MSQYDQVVISWYSSIAPSLRRRPQIRGVLYYSMSLTIDESYDVVKVRREKSEA